MPKQGSRRKKTKTHKEITEQEYDSVPKSIVMKRTDLPKEMKLFEKNLREMFYPFTALKLKENTKLKIKDVLVTSKNFGVDKLLFLSSNDRANYLKMVKAPHGPTFTFRILKYSLNNDIQKYIPRNKQICSTSLGVAMSICSGFKDLKPNCKISQKNLQLIQGFFSNLFPTLEYFKKVNAKTFKRCVLFHYDQDLDQYEIRNYYLKHTFTGINKNIKKILNSKKLPDLSKLDDIGDLFVKNNIELSDSDIDNLPDTNVELQDKVLGKDSKYNVKVRLYEIGPRITLKLLKIEEGFLKGEVLHHSIIQKTKEQKIMLKKRFLDQEKHRQEQIKIQNDNVEKKQILIQEKLLKKRKKFRDKQKALDNRKSQLKNDDNKESNSKEEKSKEESEHDFEQFTGDKNFVQLIITNIYIRINYSFNFLRYYNLHLSQFISI